MSAIQVHERIDTKKKSWYYRFETPSINGKRQTIKKSGFKTKKEAEIAGNKEYSLYYSNTSSLIDEIDPDTRKLSFQDYIDEHWWPLNKNKWKTTTMVGYRKKLDNYLIPSFGACSLEAIKSERLQMYFDKLYLEEQTAICTVNDLRSLTAQIFKFAVTHRHLRFSPMDAVTPPNNRVMPTANKNRQIRDAISNDILEKIFERFPEGTATYIPCKLSVLAGLRLGEAFGLAWHDIDFDNHWIYVTRQVQMRTKEYFLNAREAEMIKLHPELSDFRVYTCNPKDESKRIVPMAIELEELLKREYEKQQQNRLFLGQLYKKYYYTKATDPYLHPRDYMNFNIKKLNSLDDYEDGMVNDKGIGYPIDFVNVRDDGTLICPGVTQHMSAVIHGKGTSHGNSKNSGKDTATIYQGFNVHSLRHTFASNMRANGVPEHVIQELLGHKSPETTQTYMHITTEQFNATAKKMHSNSSYVDELLTELSQKNLSDTSY